MQPGVIRHISIKRFSVLHIWSDSEDFYMELSSQCDVVDQPKSWVFLQDFYDFAGMRRESCVRKCSVWTMTSKYRNVRKMDICVGTLFRSGCCFENLVILATRKRLFSSLEVIFCTCYSIKFRMV